MLKIGRKSILTLLILSIVFGSGLVSGCVGDDEPVGGINIIWDYSYFVKLCAVEIPEEVEPLGYSSPTEFAEVPFTVGELLEIIKSVLESSGSPCKGSTDFYLYLKDSSGTRILPDSMHLSDLAGVTENTTLFFGPRDKDDSARLTLYGYSIGGGKSCVLWSLDGSTPINVDKKCGGEPELVCVVKLVGKDLKYDCEEGHESMGFNIAHDPKWLSWADKFARRYKR
jgi:hypothetical protein